MTCRTPGALKAYDELLTALELLAVDTPVTADTWRARADQAHLTSAEVSAAHRRACREGYLTPFRVGLPDGTSIPGARPSETDSRKGGRNLVYSRTSKALPIVDGPRVTA